LCLPAIGFALGEFPNSGTRKRAGLGDLVATWTVTGILVLDNGKLATNPTSLSKKWDLGMQAHATLGLRLNIKTLLPDHILIIANCVTSISDPLETF